MRVNPLRIVRSLAVAALLSLGLGAPTLNAARDAGKARPATAEILVLEVKGCTICSLVRTRIQPAYERTPRARSVPMRYVDISAMDELKLGLKSRVDTVPTIVVMRDGAELDRMTGYMGPAAFFQSLDIVLGPSE